MSTTPATSNDGFHVVVAEDGSLLAAELARLGLRPGARLRLVPEQRHATERKKRIAGALASTVSPEAVEDLIRGLDESKAERAAYYGEAADHT